MNVTAATTSHDVTPKPPAPLYITPERLASEIHERLDMPITVRTLANWRSANKGPSFIKIGRVVRYHLADVKRWLDAQRSQQPTAAQEQHSHA